MNVEEDGLPNLCEQVIQLVPTCLPSSAELASGHYGGNQFLSTLQTLSESIC